MLLASACAFKYFLCWPSQTFGVLNSELKLQVNIKRAKSKLFWGLVDEDTGMQKGKEFKVCVCVCVGGAL